MNKFEESLEPVSVFQETHKKIKVELDKNRLIDGDRIRKILRILDSDKVSLTQKELILKAFDPTITDTNMD